MQNRIHFDHQLVEKSVAALETFMSAADCDDLLGALNPLIGRYRSGHFRLLLVGEEKRGKSSLLNALLGQPDLLPTGAEPMTACVFKVVYGPQLLHRIFFLPTDPDEPEASRPEPLDVLPEDVGAYGTEGGNPDNAKKVDFIAVEVPHPLLKAGLVIVDLPGLGGLKREHGLLTLSYLPNTDAAFFVLDSVQSAVTREEVITLEKLKRYTDNLIFVQTKIDAVSSAQWKAWRERNLSEIEQRLNLEKENVAYFPISSLLKLHHAKTGLAEDLEESGFPALTSFLEDELIAGKQDWLAASLAMAMTEKVILAAGPIENEIEILSTTSKEKLKQIDVALRTARKEYERWKIEDLPGIQSQAIGDIRAAEIEGESSLIRDLDYSAHGTIVSSLLRQIEEDSSLSARAIEEAFGAFNDATVSMCAERLEEIGQSFDESTQRAFERATKAMSTATTSTTLSTSSLRADIAFERISARSDSSLWGTLMQGRMGALTGMMAAGAVASFVFPPLGLAVTVGTILGGILGGRRSIKEAQRRERRQVENQIRIMLCDTVRRLQMHGQREFRLAVEARRASILKALSAAVKRRDLEEAANAAAVEARRHEASEQIEARLAVLKNQLVLANKVLDVLRDAGAPIDGPSEVMVV